MATDTSPSNLSAPDKKRLPFGAVVDPIKRVSDAAKDMRQRLEDDALVKKVRSKLLSGDFDADTKIHWLNELDRHGLLEELETDVMSKAFEVLVRQGSESLERRAKDAIRFASAYFVVARHSGRRNFARLIVPTIQTPNPNVLPYVLYAALFKLGCPFNATQQSLIVSWAELEQEKRATLLDDENLYVRAREMFPQGVRMLDRQRASQNEKKKAFTHPT